MIMGSRTGGITIVLGNGKGKRKGKGKGKGKERVDYIRYLGFSR